MRVLIIKTSSMGDVIHTLPALTDARQIYPDIIFDWVVEEAFAEIPAWHPAVDRVIPVAIRRWRKTPMKTLKSAEWKKFGAEMARYSYDAIIDAQGLLKSAWLTRLAKGKSYGLDRRSIKEPLASLFYQHRIAVSKEMHAVERIRVLFSEALNYQKPKSVGDYGIASSQFEGAFAAVSAESKPYLVFLHGTTRHDKHWPEPYWKELAQLAIKQGFQVKLPWGNEIEQERAGRIAELEGVEVLPKLNLRELACVIAGAQSVVAVDTGLGHLSAALAVPAVSLYGPTSPNLIGAYGENQCYLSVEGLSSEGLVPVDPAIFTPLRPKLVWDQLADLLSKKKSL